MSGPPVALPSPLHVTQDVRRASRAVREDFRDRQHRLWTVLAIGRLLPPYIGIRLRARLLRFAGATIGKRTVISGRLSLAGSATAARHLTIGDDCFINDGCRFDTSALITIDDGVYLGHDVAVLTSTHELGPPDRRAGTFTSAPIHIGRGAWIGARAVMLPGVTVGDGAVVAAGAVVTESVPPDVMVGGVPARELRRL